MQQVHVTNEVGRLKAAIIHTPGLETQNYRNEEFGQVFTLRPTRSQFDLDKATEEHASFRKALEAEGVQLLELTDLLTESITTNPEARKALIDAFLATSNIKGWELLSALRSKLEGESDPRKLVQMMCAGFRCSDVLPNHSSSTSLAKMVGELFDPDSLFLNPLYALFFTRDPAVAIGNGIACSHMYWNERNREVPLYSTVLGYHPLFAQIPIWSRHDSSFHIEGGDILNLDSTSILLGLSQRTEASAIDSLAQTILWDERSSIEQIYVVEVEEHGTRLHLDTFINRVDIDAFIIDPLIENMTHLYVLTRGKKPGTIHVRSLDLTLRAMLKEALGMSVLRFIPCDSLNEAESGAAGTLCLSPGKLCVVESCRTTNSALEKSGFTLASISIDELTSGYGGPNCLCMPLYREDI